MSMQAKTTLLIIVIVFAVTAANFLSSVHFTSGSLQKTAEQDLEFAIGIAGSLVSTQMSLMRAEAAAMAGRLAGAASDGELARLTAKELAEHPEISALAIFDRDGGVSGRAAPGPGPALQDEYLKMVYAGATVVTASLPSPAGDFVLNTCTPTASGGILSVSMPGAVFSDLLAKHRLWRSGNILLFNTVGMSIGSAAPEISAALGRRAADGAAAFGPDDAAGAVIDKMLSSDKGVEHCRIGEVEYLCAYSRIEGSALGWRVAVIVPIEESPQADALRGQTYAAALFLLVGALAAFFLSRITARPFRRIEMQNRDLDALNTVIARDLREQAKMMSAIEQRDLLLQSVNQTADILLRSESGDFAQTLRLCMGMMANAVKADRMYLAKNHHENGTLRHTRLHEWSERFPPFKDSPLTVGVVYGEDGEGEPPVPSVKSTLLRGRCVNRLVRDLPPADRSRLGAQGILSVLIVPVFIHNEFWGFVGFGNCSVERLFTENEESIMRSGALLIVNALLRNESMLRIRDTSARLESALTDAKEASTAKSTFLAHMSHEIRTPLNAVIGLSELTLGEEALSRAAETNLEKICAAGATILSIVNDILDISKIESGKFELHPARYDIASFIHDIMTLNSVRIGEKPVAFTVEADENLPSLLYGDDLRIKQIFNNLLSNALKYTHAGTVRWLVSFERSGEDFMLVGEVRDTGIGIRPEEARTLFSDYIRIDAGANRKVEGTGLGLAITKRLVDMMDGTITVESEYGKGTNVTVRLRQTPMSETPIGGETAANLASMSYRLARHVKYAKQARIDLSYAHVLVVDDIETNLDVVKGMLKPYGIGIDCAKSGPLAVEMIRAENPRYGAVFMDHMMPGMDGIEATRIIREEIGTDYARDIPIIALTANAVIGNEEMFLERGFQAFISKPIDMDRLDAVLRRWVRDRHLETDGEHNGAGPGGAQRDASGRGRLPGGGAVRGLDMEKLLKRFGGNRDVCVDVLRSYAASTPQLVRTLRACLAAEKIGDYAVAVHGLKGSSYGICAREVGRAAEELEHAAQAEDLETLRRGGPALEQAVSALLDGINEALRKIDAGARRPTAAEPDPALLRELREACAAFAMDRVDAAMTGLESFRYERGGELVAWLRGQVDDMAFERLARGEWPE